jgi:hypothetical protein
MNSELHQYPASLYSSVSEFGYRSERFTGEVLRSGRGGSHGSHRRSFLSKIRLWLGGEGRHSTAAIDLRDEPTPCPRLTVVGQAPHAHAR